VAGGKLLKAARPVAERGVQPPLEPAGSRSAGEAHSPDAIGQVIPLDRARTPRNPPPSPAAQPLSSVEEQPLAATGTDGGPVLRRQVAPGNRPTVASLEPASQGVQRGAGAPPSTPQPPRSTERVGGSDSAPAPATNIVPLAKPVLPKLGGAYKDVPASGGHVHHIPSKAISPLPVADGPAIRMETGDHVLTGSWGNGIRAQEYRAAQEALIKAGKFREAQQMDIDSIRKMFGAKYDAAIKQMQDYTDTIPAEKLLPPKGQP